MPLTGTQIHEAVQFEVDSPMTGDELNSRDHACRVHSTAFTAQEGKCFDEGWRRARAFYKWKEKQHQDQVMAMIERITAKLDQVEHREARHTEAIMLAQANLQEALGFFRTDRGHWDNQGKRSVFFERSDRLIESRAEAALARLHMLLGERGSAMYDPATHEGVTELTRHLDYTAEKRRLDP